MSSRLRVKGLLGSQRSARLGSCACALLAAVIWTANSAIVRADEPASASDPLTGFDAFVDDAIQAWQVPGLALAIVKKEDVALAKGYGYRDVASKLPVTGKTLFAIGSCTKAFTTFVIGTLVDEGKLDWDKPVTNYIPGFRMYDRVASELITPRDLVTHRSGLPRHDVVWYNASLKRSEIVERLPYLEPSETFRSKFQYNNIMFMTAGYLVDRVAGESWEEAVRTRIFAPLGMTSSNFSVQDSQKSSDFARPYADRNDKIVEIPFRDITNAGPAGSINSCVDEMAQWLIVNTQKGKSKGRQLISAAVLADIQSPQMTTGATPERREIAPAGYGLGWQIDSYRGHRRVHHGGGIDGFTTMTTLFPDDELGLIVVANLNGTPLPEMITRHAADRLLQLAPIDWGKTELAKHEAGKAAARTAKTKKETVRRSGTAAGHPLEEYAGEYEHPGYGTCRVALKDGKLHFAYNGIEAPLSHWHFEVWTALENPKDPEFEDLKVQFQSGVDGFVDGLAVAFEPRLKPIVFAKRPDARLSDPEYLKRFTGEYTLATRTLGVHLKGKSLSLDSDGQGEATLVPGLDGGFKVKEQTSTSIRFVTDKDNNTTELELQTPSGVFTAKRKKP
jgi:CubicO group peptidase (beta-lactamase class C family)